MKDTNDMCQRGALVHIKRYLIFVMLMLTVNCQKTLNSNEYVEYFSKNRMKFSKVIERNGISAIFTCHPPELYAAQTMNFDTTVDRNQIIGKYSRSLVVVLTINPVSGHVLESQAEKGKNAFLVDEKDTIYPVDFKYEPNWNPNDETSFIFAFNRENIDLERDYNFVIRNIISEIGTVEVPLKDLNRWKIRLRG